MPPAGTMPLTEGGSLSDHLRRARASLVGAARWAAASSRRHPVAWSLALAAAVTASSMLLLAPRFAVNDDTAMASVVDGSYFGEPQPHMVFSNVLLGLLLSTLYGWVGTVPWYGMYLAAVHFAALAVVVYLVLSEGERRSRLPGLVAFLGLFGLWLGTQMGFTSQGLMLAITGVVLYLARGRRRSAVVVAALLAGASTLIRWDSLLGALALALPLLIWAVWRLPWRNQALFAGILAAVVVSGVVFQKAYYAGDEAWQEYSSFNRDRGIVMEQHGWLRDDALLAEIGWSRNDAAMFASHFYLDAEVFSAADVAVLAGKGHRAPGPGHDAAGHLQRQHRQRRRDRRMGSGRRPGGGGGSCRGATRSSLRDRGAGLDAGGDGGPGMFRKLPDRVGVPLIAFAALTLLVRPLVPPPASGVPPQRRAWRAAVVACALATVALAATGVALAAGQTGARRSADRRITRTLESFAAVDPDGVFVSWGARLRFGPRSPWHAPILDGPRLLPLGWLQRSPAEAEWLRTLGIDDAYAAVAARRRRLPSDPGRPRDRRLSPLLAGALRLRAGSSSQRAGRRLRDLPGRLRIPAGRGEPHRDGLRRHDRLLPARCRRHPRASRHQGAAPTGPPWSRDGPQPPTALRPTSSW